MSAMNIKSGTKFNDRWTIDKKIGEGSCGSVYSLLEKDPSIGDLIIKCIQLPKGNSKADKELTKLANTLSYERSLYKGVLNGMDFCAALPLYHYYGEEHGCRYLIMQRLDCDLREYMASFHSSKLPVLEIANIGLAILQGLEAIHNRGYLYVDVKPDNFMIMRDQHFTLKDGTSMNNKLFFVDFGLVEKFTSVQAGGEERERTQRKGIAGTPNFASVDVLSGYSPSRKDDIEALGYVLLCLMGEGRLPWDSAGSDAEVLRMKRSADFRSAGEIGRFIESAQRMSYDSQPDYDMFSQILYSFRSSASSSRRSSGTGKAKKSEYANKRSSRESQGRSTAVTEVEKENGDIIRSDLIRSPVRTGAKRALSKQPSNTGLTVTASGTDPSASKSAPKKARVNSQPTDASASMTSSAEVYDLTLPSAQLVVVRCEAHGSYVGYAATIEVTSNKAGMIVGADDVDCDICFPEDCFMSGRHASVLLEEVRNGQVKLKIKDLTSTNGSWINGKKLAPNRWYVAHFGDLIQFGNTDFALRSVA